MTQYLDWKVGDPLVCVDDDMPSDLPPIFSRDLNGLCEGQVYTIKKIGPLNIGHPMDGDVCVWLYEISRPLDSRFRGEIGFLASRFRKVQPRKTSIAIFERLLNTQNNEVETA